MFSVRVHLAGQPGHSVYECREYHVEPKNGGLVVRMQQQDGESQIELRDGGIAFVMGDSGKTVEVIRSRPSNLQKRAELRGAVQ